MRAARVGLGAAQRAGNGAIRMFAHDMDETGQINDHPSSQMLAQALKKGDIVPHFQPQICAHSNQVIGVEALARWQQPDGTFVAPNVFLPVLESAGLMRQTTGHILNCALHARRVWADQGCHITTVSVNLSSEDLSDPRLVDQIRWHLRRHKHPATALRLEVVEMWSSRTQTTLSAKTFMPLAIWDAKLIWMILEPVTRQSHPCAMQD